MYWTRSFGGETLVATGGMDGSNPRNLVAGTGQASSIQIDLQNRRLYWANRSNKTIQSSSLNGDDVVTIHKLSEKPFGIALLRTKLYWGYNGANTVQSGGIQPGSDVQVEHTVSVSTRHFTVPIWNLPINRANHCSGRVCSGVCVLTPTSYKCVSFY